MLKKKLLCVFMIFMIITIIASGEVFAKKAEWKKNFKKGDIVIAVEDIKSYSPGGTAVERLIEKGEKLTIKGKSAISGRWTITYKLEGAKKPKKVDVDENGIEKEENINGSIDDYSQENSNRNFINDVYSFINSQKDRNWEYIEASDLFGTYNTAYVNRKKIQGNQKKYGLDNNTYNDIMNKLNDILNKSLEQIHKEGWKEDIRGDKIIWTNNNTGDQVQTSFANADNNEAEHPEDTAVEEYKPTYIFRQPTLADSTTNSVDSIDGLITDSENFLNEGTNDRINQESIQDFSKTLYNILITIATVVSVIIGGILGIKIMLASAEEKAQVKELLVPYVIGCVVVFGAFGIWKLVVNILQNI